MRVGPEHEPEREDAGGKTEQDRRVVDALTSSTAKSKATKAVGGTAAAFASVALLPAIGMVGVAAVRSHLYLDPFCVDSNRAVC